MRWLLFILLPQLLLSNSYEYAIRDYLTLKDFVSAEIVCKEALKKSPDDLLFQKLYIETLAKSGKEKEMLKSWRALYDRDPKNGLDHDLVEKMAWGVIEKGNKSSTPLVRLFSMLAAVFSQDIQGVHLVARELRSEHSGIRAVALQMASMLGDDILKPVIRELFYKEKVFDVRIAAIQAVGKLRMKDLKNDLEKLASNEKSSFEERTAAIEALLHFHDKILPFELKMLLKSEKIIHKLVGLKLAPMADFEIEIETILPLLKDEYFEVRQTALYTLGQLFFFNKNHHGLLKEAGENFQKDQNRKVQITALWLKTLVDPEYTETKWVEYLLSPKEEERLLASALLPSLGKKGIGALRKGFYKTDDPITRVNLAIGLIKQRAEIEEASSVLIDSLNQKNTLWMWKEMLGQKVLATSSVPSTSLQSPPLDVHRLCQLEILAIVAMFDKETAREGISKFLKQRNFQVTQIAMALLLTEYSEDGAAAVRPLMEDLTYPNRAEACVLLALWSGDNSMTKTMQDLYASSDRKRKEFILEAFGKISGEDSLAFLVERLAEPYPTLRMIAASSIIQCLNH